MISLKASKTWCWYLFLYSKTYSTVFLPIPISKRGKQQGLCGAFVCRFFPRSYEIPANHHRLQRDWKRSDFELSGCGAWPGSQLPAAFIRHCLTHSSPSSMSCLPQSSAGKRDQKIPISWLPEQIPNDASGVCPGRRLPGCLSLWALTLGLTLCCFHRLIAVCMPAALARMGRAG